jgi:hypothetical protein
MKAISLLLAAAVMVPGAVAAQDITSEYTDLDLAQCTVFEADDTGAMLGCPGWRGYPVMVAEGDLRMFVSFGLYAPSEPAAEQTLPPFNRLGPKIEWRLRQDGDTRVPFATILRWFTAREGGESEDQILVVTQLGTGTTCHVAYIDALAVDDANALAREIADEKAGSVGCGSEPEKVEPFEAW